MHSQRAKTNILPTHSYGEYECAWQGQRDKESLYVAVAECPQIFMTYTETGYSTFD